MLFDEIFKEIGDFGRGQIIQYFLLCWPFLMAGFLSVDVVFLMAVPDFVCKPNISATFNTTSVESSTDELIGIQKLSWNYTTTRCYEWMGNTTSDRKCTNGFLYSTRQYGSTIPVEFNLVCEAEVVRQNLKTIFFVGRIFGAIVFGQLSDLIGRLLTFLIVVICNLLAGIGLYFSVSPLMIGVFLLLQGFAQVGYTLTTFVLGTEIVGTSKRKWAGVIIQMFYTLAFIVIPLSYYVLQSWRSLALLSGFPSIAFLAYYFFVYESPRWLLTKGRASEALVIIEKIARTNKVTLSDEMRKKILEHNKSDEYKRESEQNYSVVDLIRTKPMLLLSLNVWFNWIVNALVYYGIIYNTENLSGSLYLNFLLMGLVEIPAAVTCILLLDKLGRKRLMIVSLWATGLSCLIAGMIPRDSSSIISVVALFGKFFVSISYGTLYFFTAELFPTVVRNSALGMSSTCARIGGTVAIPILGLQTHFLPLPMIIFSTLAAIAGALAFIVPETKGKPLDRQFYQHPKVNGQEEGKEFLVTEAV